MNLAEVLDSDQVARCEETPIDRRMYVEPPPIIESTEIIHSLSPIIIYKPNKHATLSQNDAVCSWSSMSKWKRNGDVEFNEEPNARGAALIF